MKTQRLFDENAFLSEFEAQVLSCEPAGKHFAVVLDRTAFFPEGGGQSADGGTLGGEKVLDVQEREGVIYHYVKRVLSGTVRGELDWEKRFERMQNHSGEHVVSGIVHRHTGADNISFSLTDSETTLAFNVPVGKELLQKVEQEANAAVFADLAIRSFYPESALLPSYDYRSKLDLSENVRLVEIEGIDLCACCAPHCRSTGQIGLIKIIRSEPYKGGTKLWIVCGKRALRHYELVLGQVQSVSHLLCAKTDCVAAATERLKLAKEKAEFSLVAMRRERIAEAVKAVEPTSGDYFALCTFVGDDLRLFADGLKAKIGGIVSVVEGEGKDYRYCITSASADISNAVKEANAALGGRGGGRDNMARGTFHATIDEIEGFFKK